jgi:hypothetical protein
MPDVTTLAQAVAAALLSLTPLAVPDTDPRWEAPQARQERLAVVGEAIAAAAARARCEPPWRSVDAPCRPQWPGSSVELAAVLAGLGYLESGFAEWVHAGRCRLHLRECDARRERGVWVAGAKSPWQLQRTGYTDAVWSSLEGTGEWSTFVAAWSATRAVSGARGFCARRSPGVPWLHATVSVYATGSTCNYPRAAKRARFVVGVLGRIRAELAGG